jgi:mRNA interferase YafQ
MLRPIESSKFRKDLKRARRRGKDLEKLKTPVGLLLAQKPLPERYRDHRLAGPYAGYRDCHIEPDWLLIYKVDLQGGTLTLVRTGTHADLFR